MFKTLFAIFFFSVVSFCGYGFAQEINKTGLSVGEYKGLMNSRFSSGDTGAIEINIKITEVSDDGTFKGSMHYFGNICKGDYIISGNQYNHPKVTIKTLSGPPGCEPEVVLSQGVDTLEGQYFGKTGVYRVRFRKVTQ